MLAGGRNEAWVSKGHLKRGPAVENWDVAIKFRWGLDNGISGMCGQVRSEARVQVLGRGPWGLARARCATGVKLGEEGGRKECVSGNLRRGVWGRTDQ